jgi:hypothetical protein
LFLVAFVRALNRFGAASVVSHVWVVSAVLMTAVHHRHGDEHHRHHRDHHDHHRTDNNFSSLITHVSLPLLLSNGFFFTAKKTQEVTKEVWAFFVFLAPFRGHSQSLLLVLSS